MELKNISTHTHQGKREYQEDSFGVGQHYLLVADGVGGAARGDVASAIVVGIVEQAVGRLGSDASLSQTAGDHDTAGNGRSCSAT